MKKLLLAFALLSTAVTSGGAMEKKEVSDSSQENGKPILTALPLETTPKRSFRFGMPDFYEKIGKMKPHTQRKVDTMLGREAEFKGYFPAYRGASGVMGGWHVFTSAVVSNAQGTPVQAPRLILDKNRKDIPAFYNYLKRNDNNPDFGELGLACSPSILFSAHQDQYYNGEAAFDFWEQESFFAYVCHEPYTNFFHMDSQEKDAFKKLIKEFSQRHQITGNVLFQFLVKKESEKDLMWLSSKYGYRTVFFDPKENKPFTSLNDLDNYFMRQRAYAAENSLKVFHLGHCDKERHQNPETRWEQGNTIIQNLKKEEDLDRSSGNNDVWTLDKASDFKLNLQYLQIRLFAGDPSTVNEEHLKINMYPWKEISQKKQEELDKIDLEISEAARNLLSGLLRKMRKNSEILNNNLEKYVLLTHDVQQIRPGWDLSNVGPTPFKKLLDFLPKYEESEKVKEEDLEMKIFALLEKVQKDPKLNRNEVIELIEYYFALDPKGEELTNSDVAFMNEKLKSLAENKLKEGDKVH